MGNTTNESSVNRGILAYLLAAAAAVVAVVLMLSGAPAAHAASFTFADNGYVGTATKEGGTIAVELTSVPDGVGGVAVYLKVTIDTPGYLDTFPISTPGDGPWNGSAPDPGGVCGLFITAGGADPGVSVDLCPTTPPVTTTTPPVTTTTPPTSTTTTPPVTTTTPPTSTTTTPPVTTTTPPVTTTTPPVTTTTPPTSTTTTEPATDPIVLDPEDFTVTGPASGQVVVKYDGDADASQLTVFVPLPEGGNLVGEFDGTATWTLDVTGLEPGTPYAVKAQYLGDDDPVVLEEFEVDAPAPTSTATPPTSTTTPPGQGGGDNGTDGTTDDGTTDDGTTDDGTTDDGTTDDGTTAPSQWGSSSGQDEQATGGGKKTPPPNAAPLGDDAPASSPMSTRWVLGLIGAVSLFGLWLGPRLTRVVGQH